MEGRRVGIGYPISSGGSEAVGVVGAAEWMLDARLERGGVRALKEHAHLSRYAHGEDVDVGEMGEEEEEEVLSSPWSSVIIIISLTLLGALAQPE